MSNYHFIPHHTASANFQFIYLHVGETNLHVRSHRQTNLSIHCILLLCTEPTREMVGAVETGEVICERVRVKEEGCGEVRGLGEIRCMSEVLSSQSQ